MVAQKEANQIADVAGAEARGRQKRDLYVNIAEIGLGIFVVIVFAWIVKRRSITDRPQNEFSPVNQSSSIGASSISVADSGKGSDTAEAVTAGRLTDLAKLQESGSITADEFEALRSRMIGGNQSRKFQTSGNLEERRSTRAGLPNSVSWFVAVILAAFVLFVTDQKIGPILPDILYCAVSAGTVIDRPGETVATSWSANDGCSAYKPECANAWKTTPPTSYCLHGTLWDAVDKKLQRMQGTP